MLQLFTDANKDRCNNVEACLTIKDVISSFILMQVNAIDMRFWMKILWRKVTLFAECQLPSIVKVSIPFRIYCFEVRPNIIGWTDTVRDETVCDLARLSKSMLSLSWASTETDTVFRSMDDLLKRK